LKHGTKRAAVLRRGRTTVGVAILTVVATIALATSASAATYQMGSVTYSNACGVAAMSSVFNASAVDDGSSKVDFNGLTEGARIYLPSSCAVATQICLDERITAHTKSGGFVTSAPFGTIPLIWGNYHAVVGGNQAAGYGTNCKTGFSSRSATVTANASSDDSPMVYTGGQYKLGGYTYETRVRYYQSGAWHYGAWNSFTKSY
jgi:hypothetical protein